jgi:hypothetical protein
MSARAGRRGHASHQKTDPTCLIPPFNSQVLQAVEDDVWQKHAEARHRSQSSRAGQRSPSLTSKNAGRPGWMRVDRPCSPTGIRLNKSPLSACITAGRGAWWFRRFLPRQLQAGRPGYQALSVSGPVYRRRQAARRLAPAVRLSFAACYRCLSWSTHDAGRGIPGDCKPLCRVLENYCGH